MIITEYIYQDLDDTIADIVSELGTTKGLDYKAREAVKSRLKLHHEAFPALRSQLIKIVTMLYEKKLREFHEVLAHLTQLRLTSQTNPSDWTPHRVARRQEKLASHLVKTVSEL